MSPFQYLNAVLDDEHSQGVIDHRKALKKPLTELAAKLLAKQFALCPDPNAAAEEMLLRGWVGLKSEWLQQRSFNRPTRGLESIEENFRQELSYGHGLRETESSDHPAIPMLPLFPSRTH